MTPEQGQEVRSDVVERIAAVFGWDRPKGSAFLELAALAFEVEPAPTDAEWAMAHEQAASAGRAWLLGVEREGRTGSRGEGSRS